MSSSKLTDFNQCFEEKTKIAMAEPVAPEVITFALMPTLVTEGLLDYSMRAGQAIYAAAVQLLNEDDLFDCNPTGLHQFLTLLTD